MSTMSKRDGNTFNIAPDSEGRNDEGYENLKVKLLHWPEKYDFQRLMTKASVAVKGSIVEDDEVDEVLVEDIFKGGLNQSLEWITVVFECSGVSRSLTHQLVRTRKASFAQQSQRYADMGNFNARMPLEIASNPVAKEIWLHTINTSRLAYKMLADLGIPMQDVRSVTPTAIETYIICNYPLSEFLALYSYRACQMFFPEMVAIMGLMREVLIEKCPWLEEHIKISCEKTSPGIDGHLHRCTYQGLEPVEGQCTFEWAKENNRTFKSRRTIK
jgi:thymidylate synthase (FAD)